MQRFKPNPLFQEHLARDPEFRKAIAAHAERARGHAQAMARADGAPWMRRGSADTIVVSTDGDEVRLVNTDHAGHLMEWGSANNPPHAPLRRGVRAAGLRLDETAK